MEPYDPLLLSRRVRHAIAAGVEPAELRGPLWTGGPRGVVRPAWVAHDAVTTRLSDAVALMDAAHVLGGWAAARAQGTAWLDGERVPIHCLPGGQLRVRDDIVPWRGRLHPDEIVDLGGYRVATLARAAMDEMCRSRSLRRAVAVADLAISTTSGAPHTSAAAISAVLAAHPKVRGIVQAREALALASPRSASPLETRVRLIARLDLGIERIRVNVPIFRPDDRLAGIADLLEEETGLVIEADGAGHRGERQHADDNSREEGFEYLGLTVCRLTSLDAADPAAAAGRIVRARVSAQRSGRGTWTVDPPGWWATWPQARRWQ